VPTTAVRFGLSRAVVVDGRAMKASARVAAFEDAGGFA